MAVGTPSESLPTPADVEAAASRLAGVANRTPVMRSRTLDVRVGGQVCVKCENFQRTGSFKFRGAYNALSQLSEQERRRGVLAFSSGNHAQAVALAGRLLGVATTIVMPEDAPRAKLAATREYGAEIVLYDPVRVVREELAATIREERGMVLVPPYDHPDIVAGQGTAALELLEEEPDLDLLVVPCGGGGLLSGSALAAARLTRCRVIGVEPERADDAARTLRTGTLHTVRNPETVADGLRTPSLGRVTWPLIREHVADIVTVSEEEIIDAMRFYWTRMKLMVEPSGAVALAALMNRALPGREGRVGVLISGGNSDLETACRLLSGG